MKNPKIIIAILGLSIASIATPWPIHSFDLRFFNWFAVCPDGHMAFGGEQHCCADEREELLAAETAAMEIPCGDGQMYLEDKEIGVDFETTEDRMADRQQVCGEDKNYIIEFGFDSNEDDYVRDNPKFGLARILDGPLAGKAVRCYCYQQTEDNKPLVYHSDMNECYPSFTQGPCEAGQWLVPSACDDGKYKCVQNHCLETDIDTRKVVQYNRSCVGLMERCPGNSATYQVHEETGLVECVGTKLTETRHPTRPRPIPRPSFKPKRPVHKHPKRLIPISSAIKKRPSTPRKIRPKQG